MIQPDQIHTAPYAAGPRLAVSPSGPKAHRRLHEMYFPKHLIAVLRRERARADRQNGQFCLVMFRLVPARGRWATLRLSRLVLNEVRATDEIGMYDRHTVCAILPDTDAEGATRLIQRVNDIARIKNIHVEPVLYTYPTNWIDRHDYHNNGGNSVPAGGKANGNGHSTDLPNAASARTVLAEDETLYPPRPLETLLARKPAFIKRAIDIAASGSALLVLSPVMLGVAAIIKLTSPGPVMFCQQRSGMGGKPFWIYKFRTMIPNADAMKAQLRAQSEQDGPAFKMTRDPRITTIGHFLRKTSLDELPQLLNILKGDMSLVGPRPLPLDEQAECDQWHQSRLDVRPGLTCIWQVHGRSSVSFEEWMRMDLGYIHRYQVWNDIKLIFQTVPAVLLRRGAK